MQLSENGVPEYLEMGSGSQNSAAFDVSLKLSAWGAERTWLDSRSLHQEADAPGGPGSFDRLSCWHSDR